MRNRHDALRAAARVIAQVHDICLRAGDLAVATVGVLEVKPGAVSNIPALAAFTLDVRDRSAQTRRAIVDEVDMMLAAVCKEGGLEWVQDTFTEIEPTPMDPSLCNLLVAEAQRGNVSCKTMVSGAGHDAMIFAPHVPTTMIFVPSKGGKSHTPEEDTDIADIMHGVYLLYRGLHRLGYEG